MVVKKKIMDTTKVILLMVCCLLFATCKKDERKSEAEKIVSEWSGKKIEFFPDLQCIYLDKDTVCPPIEMDKFKILVYTDSSGCTSCKLKMYEWNRIFNESDSLFPGKLSFLFVFQPKDITELRFLMKRDNLRQRVFIDKESRFRQINDIPSQHEYQAFLLDENNNVAAIGNPVSNPGIWNLYKQIISGKEKDQATGEPNLTSVEADRLEIEIPGLTTNETKEVDFVLKNTGNNPLIIQTVNASCGCTVPTWERKPVMPGKTTRIMVMVKPESAGYFNKKIMVYCNVPDGHIALTVKSNIIQ